jgi:hypothetical protein
LRPEQAERPHLFPVEFEHGFMGCIFRPDKFFEVFENDLGGEHFFVFLFAHGLQYTKKGGVFCKKALNFGKFACFFLFWK